MTVSAHRCRSRRFALVACLFAIVAVVPGCGPDPAERLVLRLEALNDLLEAHKTEPDVLLDELERFVEEHRDAWSKDRAAFDALSEDKRAKLSAKYDNRLNEAMLHLMELTGEIQDRLRSNPAQLARFLALLREISADD